MLRIFYEYFLTLVSFQSHPASLSKLPSQVLTSELEGHVNIDADMNVQKNKAH